MINGKAETRRVARARSSCSDRVARAPTSPASAIDCADCRNYKSKSQLTKRTCPDYWTRALARLPGPSATVRESNAFLDGKVRERPRLILAPTARYVQRALLEHWNGTGWTEWGGPNPRGETRLFDVTTVPGTTHFWAVGDSGGKPVVFSCCR